MEGSTIFLVRVPLVDQEARLRSRAHPQPGAPGSPGCPPASPGALHDAAGPGHFAVTGTAPPRPCYVVLFSFSGTLVFQIPYLFSAFSLFPLLFSVHGVGHD